jgi:hypothetical protein
VGDAHRLKLDVTDARDLEAMERLDEVSLVSTTPPC